MANFYAMGFSKCGDGHLSIEYIPRKCIGYPKFDIRLFAYLIFEFQYPKFFFFCYIPGTYQEEGVHTRGVSNILVSDFRHFWAFNIRKNSFYSILDFQYPKNFLFWYPFGHPKSEFWYLIKWPFFDIWKRIFYFYTALIHTCLC